MATQSSDSTTSPKSGRSSAMKGRHPRRAAICTADLTISLGRIRREDCMPAKFDLNDSSVVVIVGSGAGGGTLANELAQKGISSVVLEAGKRLEISDFKNDEDAMFGLFTWLDPRTSSGS